jgi:hypothetical protein
MIDKKISNRFYFFFSKKEKATRIRLALDSHETFVKCSFCLLDNGQEVEYTACSPTDKKMGGFDDYEPVGFGIKAGTRRKNVKDENKYKKISKKK